MADLQQPLKWYRELAGKKGRRGAGVFLVEGEKAIRQIAGSQPGAVTGIVSSGEPPPDLRHYPVRRVSASRFRYISHTRTPQGIAALVKIPQGTYSDSLPAGAGRKILLLEDIQDPGNTGTLIRTAAAFGFSGVILTDKCADPFSPKVVQAGAGAALSLWLRATARYLDMAKTLRQHGYPLIAALPDGPDGMEVMDRDRLVLALGNEAAGISHDLLALADYQVRVPIAREKAESLNAAVCGGILMYLSAEKKG